MKKLVLFLVCSFAMMAAIAQSINSNKDGAVTDTKNNFITEYKGPCACLNPITTDDFNLLLSDIRTGMTNHARYVITRREIADKCLLASQVWEIMQLFTKTYSSKAILKLAKNHTYDLNNYYDLYSVYYYNNSPLQAYNQVYRQRNQFILDVNKFYNAEARWRIENRGVNNDVY